MSFIRRHHALIKRLSIPVILALPLFFLITEAAPPTSKYAPGEELNPTCAPGDVNCTVSLGWELNTTDGYVYNDTDFIGIGTDFSTAPYAQLTNLRSYTAEDNENGQFGDYKILGIDNQVTIDNSNMTPPGQSGYSGLQSIIDWKNGDPGDGSGIIGLLAAAVNSSSSSGQMGVTGLGISAAMNDSGAGDVTGGQIFSFAGAQSTPNTLGGLQLFTNSETDILGSSYGIFNAVRIDGNTGPDSDILSGLISTIDIGGNSENSIFGGDFFANIEGNTTASVTGLRASAGAGSTMTEPLLGVVASTEVGNTANIARTDVIQASFSGGTGAIVGEINMINVDNFSNNLPATDIGVARAFNIDSSVGNPILSATNTYGIYMSPDSLEGLTSEYGLYIADAEAENYFVNGLRLGVDSADYKLDGVNNGGTAELYFGTDLVTSYIPSDERLKTSIANSTVSIDDIMNIRIVDFTYDQSIINDGGDVHVGVIAQELEQVFPDAVRTKRDGYKVVDYQSLVPMLIKAVQDLEYRLAEAENQIKLLGGSIPETYYAPQQYQQTMSSEPENSVAEEEEEVVDEKGTVLSESENNDFTEIIIETQN